MDNIDKLICSFQQEIKVQHEATLEGDYKRNNLSVKVSHKIFKKLRKLDKVQELLPLLDSKHPEIRVSSAVYCLPIAEEKCLNTLEEIRDGNYKILSLGAEYAINNWLNKEYYLWEEKN